MTHEQNSTPEAGADKPLDTKTDATKSTEGSGVNYFNVDKDNVTRLTKEELDSLIFDVNESIRKTEKYYNGQTFRSPNDPRPYQLRTLLGKERARRTGEPFVESPIF